MDIPVTSIRCPLHTIAHPRTGQRILCYECDFRNLYETLRATACRTPERTAAVDDRETVTWQQLCRRVDRVSAAMYDRYHVRPGDRVGLLMMNSIDFCTAFYAIVKLGAIAVVLNTKIAPPQLAWMLNDTGADLLFSVVDWVGKLRTALGETQVRRVIFGSGDTPALEGVACATMDALSSDGDAPVCRELFAPALIMYTSGTTGTPKGALISHFNVLQNVLSYADILRMDENECTVIGVPMFHITGLSCLMALFVYLGGKMVLMPKFHAGRCNELMRLHKATHIHAVPSIYTMLYDAQPDGQPIESLRCAVCGGGAIAADTIRRYCGRNPHIDFHCAYGMTETAGAGVLFPTHYFDVDKGGASGIVAPNTVLRVCDDQGRPVPNGVIGEICFGGSVVIDHYWGRRQGDGFRDGLLLSGDLGKIDDDGYVYVVDRKKDMINRSGEKIFSILVEKELYAMPEVDLCAVFPVRDERHGEVPAAVVTLRPGAELTPEAIRDFLMTRLAKYEVPQYIRIVDEIPLNPNNKMAKHQLRAYYEPLLLSETEKERF